MAEHIFFCFLTGLSVTFMIPSTLVVGMNLTLAKGSKSGLAFGLGNALVQILWGSLALIATAGTIKGYPSIDNWGEVVGAIFMFFMAKKIYESTKETQILASENTLQNANKDAFVLGAGLTLTAPQRILLYVLFFSGLDVKLDPHNVVAHISSVGALVLGCFVTWLIVVAVATHLRDHVTPNHIRKIQLASVILLVIMGATSTFGALSNFGFI